MGEAWSDRSTVLVHGWLAVAGDLAAGITRKPWAMADLVAAALATAIEGKA
jgi:hypothetical protein